jgi:hypothetical protein
MNFYILINSIIYFLGWNLYFLPKSEVPSLVLGWSLLLFAPLFIISELSKNSNIDKCFYRSFRGHRFDRLMIVCSVFSGVVGLLSAFVFGAQIFEGLFVHGLVGLIILNTLFVGGLQFLLYSRLLKQQKAGPENVRAKNGSKG